MECAICYEAVTAATGRSVMSCGHEFHMRCLVQWLQKPDGSGSCPCCRKEPGELERLMAPPVDSEDDSDEDDDDDDDSDEDDYDAVLATDVTPLMEAAVLGDLVKLRQLICEGAEIEARDSDGDTALVYAVINGKDAAVSSLLSSGADIKALSVLSVIGSDAKSVNAALLAACQYNSFVSVASALEMGANPNYPHPVTGVTPIMEAVRCNSGQDIVDFLLKKGADVYAIDTDGWNVFMWFAEDCGDTDIMASLLSAAGPRMMPQIRNAAAAKKIQALWRGYHTRLTMAVKQ